MLHRAFGRNRSASILRSSCAIANSTDSQISAILRVMRILRLKEVLSLCAILGFSFGCASKTYIDQQKFRSIGFSQDLAGLESAGSILSKDCTWMMFGQLMGDSPSLESAIENAVSDKESSLKENGGKALGVEGSSTKSQIRLLLNVQTWNESWSSIVLGRKCIKLTAVAYR